MLCKLQYLPVCRLQETIWCVFGVKKRLRESPNPFFVLAASEAACHVGVDLKIVDSAVVPHIVDIIASRHKVEGFQSGHGGGWLYFTDVRGPGGSRLWLSGPSRPLPPGG